jgi:hypothetical protein
VGRYKAEVAAEFINKRIPGCRVTPYNCKIQVGMCVINFIRREESLVGSPISYGDTYSRLSRVAQIFFLHFLNYLLKGCEAVALCSELEFFPY